MAFLFYKYNEWENNQWCGWGLSKEIPGSFSDYMSYAQQASHKTK